VQVIDHFIAGSDDQIGLAFIPMRGMLDYGFVESELAYLESPVAQPVPAGRIEGYISADGVPPHCQFGDVGTCSSVRVSSRSLLVISPSQNRALLPLAFVDCSLRPDPDWSVQWR